ncbi:MAG: hypothetical protein HY238_08405 [Acidobacteria bacterium]|nr:hypothetical protein [Acidobacteriota bacterium]
MKRRLVFRLIGSGALFVLGAMVGHGQQEPKVPESVSTLAGQAESVLIKTLDVAGMLEPAQKEVVALLKTQPRAAKSWQLDPALARDMKDVDLFRFVVSRANSYVFCSAALLSRHSLEQVGETAVIKGDVFSGKWANTSSGQVWISHDGTFLADAAGRPLRLRTQEDIKNYWTLDQRFTPLAKPLLEKHFWDTDLFRSNLAYLKQQYGGSPSEDREMAKALGIAPEGTAYSVRLFNLLGFIQYSAGKAKLVFVSPLSH